VATIGGLGENSKVCRRDDAARANACVASTRAVVLLIAMAHNYFFYINLLEENKRAKTRGGDMDFYKRAFTELQRNQKKYDKKKNAKERKVLLDAQNRIHKKIFQRIYER
jgi:hypothetical protein